GQRRRLHPRAGRGLRDRRGAWRRGAAGRCPPRPQHDLAGEARPRGQGMIASESAASTDSVMSSWRRVRHAAFWLPLADAFAVLTALTLPWSTSLTGIFSACWLGAAAFVVDYPAYFRSLKHPISALPLALFVLVAIGPL